MPSSRPRTCAPWRRGDAEPVVGGDLSDECADERVVEHDVDEAGSGELRARCEAVEVGDVEDRLGDVAWGTAELLGQGKGAVGLGVGTVGGPDHRIDSGPPCDGVERRLQTLGEELQGVGHSGPLWRADTEHRFRPRRPAATGRSQRTSGSATEREVVHGRAQELTAGFIDVGMLDVERR